jgi:hypothetical protein
MKRLAICVLACLVYVSSLAIAQTPLDQQLIVAIANKNLADAEAAIVAGADVNAKVKMGSDGTGHDITPLEASVFVGFPGARELLIAKGARPDPQNDMLGFITILLTDCDAFDAFVNISETFRTYSTKMLGALPARLPIEVAEAFRSGFAGELAGRKTPAPDRRSPNS